MTNNKVKVLVKTGKATILCYYHLFYIAQQLICNFMILTKTGLKGGSTR